MNELILKSINLKKTQRATKYIPKDIIINFNIS